MSISSSSRIVLLRTEHGTLLRYWKLKHLISSRLLCGHPTYSPDLNPVDYKIIFYGVSCKRRSTDLEYVMSVSCEVELWRHGTKWISASLMNQSNSGVLVFAHAWLPKGVNLNINFNFPNV